MSEAYSHETEERASTRQAAIDEPGRQEAEANAQNYTGPHAGLAEMSGRGNGSTRTASLQRAQRTQGNRAVQRLVQDAGGAPVQRVMAPDDWNAAAGGDGGGLMGDLTGGGSSGPSMAGGMAGWMGGSPGAGFSSSVGGGTSDPLGGMGGGPFFNPTPPMPDLSGLGNMPMGPFMPTFGDAASGISSAASNIGNGIMSAGQSAVNGAMGIGQQVYGAASDAAAGLGQVIDDGGAIM